MLTLKRSLYIRKTEIAKADEPDALKGVDGESLHIFQSSSAIW